MNAMISLLRLIVIALVAAVLISYARRKREDKKAREENETRETRELEQWWGAVAGHVTEKEAEDAALKLRERASKAQGKRIASNKAVRTVPPVAT